MKLKKETKIIFLSVLIFDIFYFGIICEYNMVETLISTMIMSMITLVFFGKLENE